MCCICIRKIWTGVRHGAGERGERGARWTLYLATKSRPGMYNCDGQVTRSDYVLDAILSSVEVP